MSKKAKKCIFCENGSVTKEHVWPVWAHPLIAKGPEGSYREEAHVFTEKTRYIGTPLARERQGDVKQKTLRVVCAGCNNGWMSLLEQEARPWLEAMICGLPFEIDEDARSVVTKWIIMKTMVTEQSRPEESVFTKSERDAFYRYRTIPANLGIYVGVCGEDAWVSAYLRHSTIVSRPNAPPPADGRRNIQSIALGIGKLFVVMTHCRLPDTNLSILFDQIRDLRRLYPGTKKKLNWPLPGISWQQANTFATFQERLLKSPLTEWRELPTAKD